MQVRLYSDYPFKSRKDSKARDDFEKEALAALGKNPNQTIDHFEDYAGRASLRFAKARIMEKGCVQCHNTHPESIKKDWKVGDVGGVLEIIRPLDEDIARTRAGLQGTFILVAAVSGSLLMLSGWRLSFEIGRRVCRRERMRRWKGMRCRSRSRFDALGGFRYGVRFDLNPDSHRNIEKRRRFYAISSRYYSRRTGYFRSDDGWRHCNGSDGAEK